MNKERIIPATFHQRLIPFSLGLIFLVPAIILTFVSGAMGIASLTEQWRLKNWTKASAIIEESQANQQPSAKCKFSLLYRYSFNGEEFHSHRFEPFRTNILIDYTKAQSLVHQYSPGSTLTVYVDPTHPGHAFVSASMKDGYVACVGIAFCLAGLYFTGYTIYVMWRSATALVIIRRRLSLGVGTGSRFYFYDSLDAAHKATECKPYSQSAHVSSQFTARIKPFLGGLLSGSIGIAGLIALVTLHNCLPGPLVMVGFILMPAFTIMGIGLMWRTATAKYVVETTGPFDQKEISFLDSKDVLLP